nr:MAG TPA: hypothetical protein [Caudoviricetes sp.]
MREIPLLSASSLIFSYVGNIVKSTFQKHNKKYFNFLGVKLLTIHLIGCKIVFVS